MDRTRGSTIAPWRIGITSAQQSGRRWIQESPYMGTCAQFKLGLCREPLGTGTFPAERGASPLEYPAGRLRPSSPGARRSPFRVQRTTRGFCEAGAGRSPDTNPDRYRGGRNLPRPIPDPRAPSRAFSRAATVSGNRSSP
jgi:hypothetical protein